MKKRENGSIAVAVLFVMVAFAGHSVLEQADRLDGKDDNRVEPRHIEDVLKQSKPVYKLND